MSQSNLKLVAPRFRALQKNQNLILDRNLPSKGKILVKVGQKVLAHEAVGEAYESVGFRNLALARLLGVKPAQAEEVLAKPIGARIYEGELLARRIMWRGLRKVEVYSPISGDIKGYDLDHDQLQIAYLPRKVRVVAGVKGRVAEIVPGQAARLRTTVDVIRGHLGLGKAREGILACVANPDVPIAGQAITAELKGRIIFGGSQLPIEVLDAALAVGVRGIVCGGIEAVDFKKIATLRGGKEDIGISVVFTEGFANLVFNKEVFAYLSQRQGEYVFVDGSQKRLLVPSQEESRSRVESQRDRSDEKDLSWVILKVGQKVRILAGERRNHFGIITKLDERKKEVTVKLTGGDREVLVHGYNVEVNE